MNTELQTIHQWLDAMRHSVQQHDLDRHMALVSERVQVYGMPKGEIIDYPLWRQKRRTEFKHRRLVAVQYGPIRVKNLNLRRLAFNVDETLIAREGFVYIINKDIMLEQEVDGHWRVIEETIHHWSSRHFQQAAGADD